MTSIIVGFDVMQVDHLSHFAPRVQLSGVVRQVGIIGNAFLVVFEMSGIDGIKPYQSREQLPVSFCNFGF